MSDIDLQAVLSENDGVVPPDISLQLLSQLKSSNESMSGLEDSDLETLSEVMDFLPFGAGDPLITKGEAATWLGYIALGGVDVIIGGKTVATMPAGKLLGGMGLFFGGTRTVDCGGGSEGGIIAAIRFDALEEMVTTAPEVAVRVYGAIAKGELQNLQSRLGETKKKDDDKQEGDKKGGKKKGRRKSVHAQAKAEVLYRSKAAAAAKERKALAKKMDNLKNAEKKRKMQAKNEKLARKKLEKEIKRLKELLEERDDEMEELNDEMGEMQKQMEGVQKIKDSLAQANKENAELKRRLAEKGGDITIVHTEEIGKGKSGCSADELEKLLEEALAKVAELEKGGAKTRVEGSGGDKEELERLRKEHEILKNKLNSESLSRMNEIASLKSANDKHLESLKALTGQHTGKQIEVDKLKSRNLALENLVKELRQRLAAGGWTKARGEARLKLLEQKLTDTTTELAGLQDKCGKDGAKYDKCARSLCEAQALSHEYFTSWLVECLARREAVTRGEVESAHLKSDLEKLKALWEAKLKKLEMAWAEEKEKTQKAHASEINELQNQYTQEISMLKQKNGKRMREVAESHGTEVSLLRDGNKQLLEQVSELEAIKARLEDILKSREATIEQQKEDILSLRVESADAKERSTALEATMGAALTRRRNEIAVCLHRIADITLLFLRVSQRCAQMDAAFGVLAPPGSHFKTGIGMNESGRYTNGPKLGSGKHIRAIKSNYIDAETSLPDATPLAVAASFISSVVLQEDPMIVRTSPRGKPKNHFQGSNQQVRPHPRDGSTVMLYREDGRGGTTLHQQNNHSCRDIQSLRTASRPLPSTLSPRSRRSPRRGRIKSRRRQELLRVGAKPSGPVWGNDVDKVFDPVFTGNDVISGELHATELDNDGKDATPSNLSLTGVHENGSAIAPTSSEEVIKNNEVTNGLSDFKPDKDLRVESRSPSVRNASTKASDNMQLDSGGSNISSSKSMNRTYTGRDQHFSSGAATSMKFSTSTLPKNSPFNRGFNAEAKESVIQFLMSMPHQDSQPRPIIRLRPLEHPGRPGTLKLSGSLPLILPSWHHIVLVDRDQNELEILSKAVSKLGYTITALSTLEEAALVIVENLVDLVICRDTMRPQADGIMGQQRGPSALRTMVEARMVAEEIQRPIAPVISSIDLRKVVTSDVDSEPSESSIPGQDLSTSRESNTSWAIAAKLGEVFTVRLPIDSEPQRRKLAATIARALGMTKMSGCST